MSAGGEFETHSFAQIPATKARFQLLLALSRSRKRAARFVIDQLQGQSFGGIAAHAVAMFEHAPFKIVRRTDV